MCKYNYSNGKCANINIDAYFCVGERNCSLLTFLRVRDFRKLSWDVSWQEKDRYEGNNLAKTEIHDRMGGAREVNNHHKHGLLYRVGAENYINNRRSIETLEMGS